MSAALRNHRAGPSLVSAMLMTPYAKGLVARLALNGRVVLRAAIIGAEKI